MQHTLKVILSFFMFLQYFIWGSWYSSMGTYLANTLKFEGTEIGAAYGAFAIGAMISPFFVGLIADRYFASEKLLGVLGLLGGGVLCLLPQATSFGAFYPALIFYCALYVPTLALGNSLSLHHLANPQEDFPRVKTLSAIGWIAGGVVLSLLKGEQSPIQFYLAGGASLLFGLFSFFLPATPPRKVGQNVPLGEILGLDALALLRRPSFAIFIACMFLICIPLYFYFVNMSIYLTELKWDNIAGKMTLAQVSDVIFLFLLPAMLRNLGYKKTIFLGILAWALRYFFLSRSVGSGEGVQTALIFSAIVLHGICYDFLFIAGQLYVDEEATERNRSATQGFIAFILWGVGAFVGTLLAGQVMSRYELAPGGALLHDWSQIWLLPALGAAAVLVVFAACFREPTKAGQQAA
ncbi:MAG: MFS transporter [Armatimonadetes bacterium]|nr:MFS transporter [Armatimonadota bacterium]